MTDPNDITRAWERREHAAAEATARNMTVLFDALTAASITAVAVSFDGEGDDGQISDIQAFNDEHPVPLPNVTIKYLSPRDERLDATDTRLEDAVEILCYDFLSQAHEGWEVGSGAHGGFHFDLTRRTIELQFHSRYTGVDTSTHLL